MGEVRSVGWLVRQLVMERAGSSRASLLEEAIHRLVGIHVRIATVKRELSLLEEVREARSCAEEWKRLAQQRLRLLDRVRKSAQARRSWSLDGGSQAHALDARETYLDVATVAAGLDALVDAIDAGIQVEDDDGL